jgi:hypothetical protein
VYGGDKVKTERKHYPNSPACFLEVSGGRKGNSLTCITQAYRAGCRKVFLDSSDARWLLNVLANRVKELDERQARKEKRNAIH